MWVMLYSTLPFVLVFLINFTLVCLNYYKASTSKETKSILEVCCRCDHTNRLVWYPASNWTFLVNIRALENQLPEYSILEKSSQNCVWPDSKGFPAKRHLLIVPLSPGQPAALTSQEQPAAPDHLRKHLHYICRDQETALKSQAK